MYQRVCEHTGCGHRAVWRWTQVALCACTLLNWTQVTRLNTELFPWLPEPFFLLGGDMLETVVHRFQLMPFLVMASKLCPAGIEGVLFATFMSLSNFSHQCAGFTGAALARRLGIVRKEASQAEAQAPLDYSNLPAALLVRAVLVLVPLLFLEALVPKEFAPPDVDDGHLGNGEKAAMARKTTRKLKRNANQTKIGSRRRKRMMT